MSFWARYVNLKVEQGANKNDILALIENKLGLEKRQEIEAELE